MLKASSVTIADAGDSRTQRSAASAGLVARPGSGLACRSPVCSAGAPARKGPPQAAAQERREYRPQGRAQRPCRPGVALRGEAPGRQTELKVWWRGVAGFNWMEGGLPAD